MIVNFDTTWHFLKSGSKMVVLVESMLLVSVSLAEDDTISAEIEHKTTDS